MDSRSVISEPMRPALDWMRWSEVRPCSLSFSASVSSSSVEKPWMLRSGVRRSCDTE